MRLRESVARLRSLLERPNPDRSRVSAASLGQWVSDPTERATVWAGLKKARTKADASAALRELFGVASAPASSVVTLSDPDVVLYYHDRSEPLTQRKLVVFDGGGFYWMSGVDLLRVSDSPLYQALAAYIESPTDSNLSSLGKHVDPEDLHSLEVLGTKGGTIAKLLDVLGHVHGRAG